MLLRGKDTKPLHFHISESLCCQVFLEHLLCWPAEHMSPVINCMEHSYRTAPATELCSVLPCWFGSHTSQRLLPVIGLHGRDTKAENSWETQGSSDDDFYLRASWGFSKTLLVFSEYCTKGASAKLSFLLSLSPLLVVRLHGGWMACSTFLIPPPQFLSLVFPLMNFLNNLTPFWFLLI